MRSRRGDEQIVKLRRQAGRLDEAERLLNRICLWRGQLPSDLHGDIAEFMGSEDLAIIGRACGELNNG